MICECTLGCTSTLWTESWRGLLLASPVQLSQGGTARVGGGDEALVRGEEAAFGLKRGGSCSVERSRLVAIRVAPTHWFGRAAGRTARVCWEGACAGGAGVRELVGLLLFSHLGFWTSALFFLNCLDAGELIAVFRWVFGRQNV